MTSSKEKDLSLLLSSATLIMAGQVFVSGSQLLERVVIARFLTPDAYGEVSMGLALFTFGYTIALLGFQQGVPRYMSRFHDDVRVRGVWATGLLVTSVASLVVAALFAFNTEWVARLLFEREASRQLLALFAVCIPLYVLYRVAIEGIRGKEVTIYKTYVSDLLYPATRLALLVGLLSVGYGIVAAGLAYLGAIVVAVVGSHLLLNRLVPLVGSVELRAREMLLFSLPLVFATLASRLLTQTDTLMLGYFRPSYEVGLYSAAYPLAGGMLLIMYSFGFLYLPMASRLDAGNRRDELDEIYKLTSKWIFVVTFPLFLAFVVFADDVLAIFFGETYAEAWLALVFVSIGFFTSASLGRNRETISALGYTKYVMYANVLAFGLNFGLNLLLIPIFGFVGAAVTSAISYVALNGFVYYVLKAKFSITPFSRWTVKTYTIVPVCLFPPAILLSRVVTLSLLTLPVFLVLAGLATLAVVSVSGCLQPEDAVPIELIEDRLDVTLPYVHRFIPER